MTEYCDDCSYCDDHGWWSAERMPCPTCDVVANLLAELRWCDAERRLALRALAEYAPLCDECVLEWRDLRRDAHAIRHATNELRGEVYCDEHGDVSRELVWAEQIALADEEIER